MLNLFNQARHEARLSEFQRIISSREAGPDIVDPELKLSVPPAGNDFAGYIVNLFNANTFLAVWGVSFYMEPEGAKNDETKGEVEQLLVNAVNTIKTKKPGIDIELRKAFETWHGDGSTQQIHQRLLDVVREFAELNIDILAVGSMGPVKK